MLNKIRKASNNEAFKPVKRLLHNSSAGVFVLFSGSSFINLSFLKKYYVPLNFEA